MKYRTIKNTSGELPGPSCRKAIYHTREEAEDMIKHIRETRVTKEIKAYRCSVCGFWHLTSSQKSRF